MSSEPEPYPLHWYQKACATRCEQRINRAPTPNSSNSVSLNRALWDNGKILSYAFLAPHRGSSAQQSKVHKVIKEWEQCANIKFDHVDSQDAIIRITFDNRQGSWSIIGNCVPNASADAAVRSKPTMNLGWIGDNDVINDVERGVILHEFGHALGLVHEHQSPAREGKLTFVERATIDFFKFSGYTEEEIERDILDMYDRKDVRNGPELDLKSVMIYFMPAPMNKESIDVAPNNKLSDLDKAYISLLYPFDDSATKEWTVAAALRVVGLNDRAKRELQGLYDSRAEKPNYWMEMRNRFYAECAFGEVAGVQGRKNPHEKGRSSTT